MNNHLIGRLKRHKLGKVFRPANFALLMSLVTVLLFHWPFFSFVIANVSCQSLNGIFTIISLLAVMVAVNFILIYMLFFLSQLVGKMLLTLSFLVNAAGLYFITAYGIIIDESMIGNILNTNTEEAGSFISTRMVLCIILFGVIPGIFIVKAKIGTVAPRKFLSTLSFLLLFIISLVFANGSNWLWIDKNSKTLGGLTLPWSYYVNTSLHYIHKHQKARKEILLPDAKILDSSKSVVVLVIGESARSQNFSLYGYEKNTNPLLSKTANVSYYKAVSCATYTTAGVKCILEHTDSDELYETLPNYLYRNDVEVIWRTTNWGEPPLHIRNYKDKGKLLADCVGETCDYEEILLNGLKEEILGSKKNKILVVLHTSTSHGPAYSKKYPPQFDIFKPVCNSVELGDCSREELVNAYDNTIVYTDYLLHKVIENLKGLKDYNCAMIYVSDHGESLGENNIYMHGLPKSIAPKEQYEIPFIVWRSDGSKKLKSGHMLSQSYVFHSVLNFLSIESPVYNEQMSIF